MVIVELLPGVLRHGSYTRGEASHQAPATGRPRDKTPIRSWETQAAYLACFLGTTDHVQLMTGLMTGQRRNSTSR